MNTSNDGEFAIEKAIRIFPTVKQVEEFNNTVLEFYENSGIKINHIISSDRLVDASKNTSSHNLDSVIPIDVNKTGGLPKELSIFVGARVMLRYNLDTSKGLVNGAMGNITEIIWPHFRRAQLYEQDIPAVKIDFGETGIHQIDAMTVQFPAKFSCGTAERRMLPLILCWGCTVHKMQGTTVNTAVVNLGSKLFAPGQAYVALSRVRSLNGLRLDELDCGKLTSEFTANTDALTEMKRLRTLPKYTQNK